MPIPAPECDSFVPFVHKALHLTGHGRPVWPIEEKPDFERERRLLLVNVGTHNTLISTNESIIKSSVIAAIEEARI